MRIVADADIPFLKGVFEPYAEVVYEKGRAIGPGTVREADALIVRTRTRCDAALLEGSRVRMIASATIGTDHADLEYCRRRGIRFENAAGCNAGGVMQHVYTALFAWAEKTGRVLLPPDRAAGSAPVLGVIGTGHVGSRVARTGEYLGWTVLRNDPPLQRRQQEELRAGRLAPECAVPYCSLEELLRKSDIVTLHVPLEPDTVSLAGADFFARMKDGAVFINTSRGEAVDEEALLQARGKLSGLIVDVWRNEPHLNRRLLECTDVATPHIAGYSYEGKLNGTTLAVRAVAEFFGIGPLKGFRAPEESPNPNRWRLKGAGQAEICRRMTAIFPIFDTDKQLREHPQDFEQLRNRYAYRREFYLDFPGYPAVGPDGNFQGDR